MDPPIVNPPIPYLGYINGGFLPGRIVRVQGRINHNSHGFKIELLCGQNANHDDVALHFNPRFSENVVIRNSRRYSSWGAEERHGAGFPFVRGQSFEVLFLCEQDEFKIAINGQHYSEFRHKVPVDLITHLTVDGDITLALIQFDGTSSPSISQPPSGHHPQINPNSSISSTNNIIPPSAPEFSSAPPPDAYNNPGYGAGFVPPPYPTGGSMGGVPPMPTFPPIPPQQGGYGQQGYPSGGYYPPPQAGYQPPQVPQYPSHHSPQPPYGAYPSQPGPQGYYPQQQGYPYGDPGGYPPPKGRGGGILDSAGKLIAGGLAGAGLANIANKIPGMGRGGGHGGHSSSGFPGMSSAGGLGSLAALGIGGAIAGKALGKKPKKMKKNKLLKYGVPLAGVGLGGYALSKGLHKGVHGFRRSSSSSSCSSNSD